MDHRRVLSELSALRSGSVLSPQVHYLSYLISDLATKTSIGPEFTHSTFKLCLHRPSYVIFDICGSLCDFNHPYWIREKLTQRLLALPRASDYCNSHLCLQIFFFFCCNGAVGRGCWLDQDSLCIIQSPLEK